jgi:hypothetical protein
MIGMPCDVPVPRNVMRTLSPSTHPSRLVSARRRAQGVTMREGPFLAASTYFIRSS